MDCNTGGSPNNTNSGAIHVHVEALFSFILARRFGVAFLAAFACTLASESDFGLKCVVSCPKIWNMGLFLDVQYANSLRFAVGR